MTTHRVDNILRAVSAHPWAIHRPKLDQIREFLNFRAQGGILTAEEIAANTAAARAPRESNRRAAVAVLPLFGTLTLRTVPMSDVGTPVLAASRAFDALMADDTIDTILLEFDTPGGTVDGIPEFADKVYEARSKKKIVAIANTMAASAGYWIYTAAEERIISPSAVVGSVGVYMCHLDFSKQNEMIGVSPSYISYGEHKVEGNYDAPLSESARAYFQAEVDKVGETFVKAVGRNMGVTPDTVRKTFGGGHVFQAKDAVDRGMADRVASFDETLERLATTRRRSPAGRSAEVERRRLALQDE
jgi:signal peptide peptidase SppA